MVNKIEVVILAAGYGTRLSKDIRNDTSGKFKHLEDMPKPLLPVAGLPLLSHWIRLFATYENSIESVNIIVNDYYLNRYQSWLGELSEEEKKIEIRLISDGSTSNETRKGAVACMLLGAENAKDNDILFIAGDTLFKEDFKLEHVFNEFNLIKKEDLNSCLITSAPVSDENVSKHGIIEVSSKRRVLKFLEKPNISETSSRLQCPCFYIIPQQSLQYLRSFLSDMENEPLSAKDATGNFIKYLIERTPVFAFQLEGRYDIGGLQSYIMCDEQFKGFN